MRMWRWPWETCGFEWLRGCAFVVRDGGRWRYHSVERELMVRYQWQRSLKAIFYFAY